MHMRGEGTCAVGVGVMPPPATQAPAVSQQRQPGMARRQQSDAWGRGGAWCAASILSTSTGTLRLPHKLGVLQLLA